MLSLVVFQNCSEPMGRSVAGLRAIDADGVGFEFNLAHSPGCSADALCTEMIATEAEFLAMVSGAHASPKNYCLTGNLDFKNTEVSAMPAQLRNVRINGCNYSISNLSITSKPLFAHIEESTVENLHFLSPTLNLSGTSEAGLIAGYASGTDFSNISIRGLSDASIENASRCGIITGIDENGTYRNIRVIGNKMTFKNCMFAGGIVGHYGANDEMSPDSMGTSIFKNIGLKMSSIVFRDFSIAGGAIGKAEISLSGFPSSLFMDRLNIRSDISAGAADQCRFNYSTYPSQVCNTVGGVIGRIDFTTSDLTLKSLFYSGSIHTQGVYSPTTASGVGGAIGYVHSPTNKNLKVLNAKVSGTMLVEHSSESQSTANTNNGTLQAGAVLGAQSTQNAAILERTVIANTLNVNQSAPAPTPAPAPAPAPAPPHLIEDGWYKNLVYEADGGRVYSGCGRPSDSELNNDLVDAKESYGSASDNNSYLLVDLKEALPVNQIRVGGLGPLNCWGRADSYWLTSAARIQVQVSNDKVTWTTLGTGKSIRYSANQPSTYRFADRNVRYVRIFLQSGWFATGIFRVGFNSTPAPAPAPTTAPAQGTNAAGPILRERLKAAKANLFVGESLYLRAKLRNSTGVSHQWYKDNQPISGTGVFTDGDFTTYFLEVPSAALADQGNYHIVFSNASGTTTTESVLINVSIPPKPKIVRSYSYEPYETGESYKQGDVIEISVSVENSLGVSVQWFKDGVPVTEGTTRVGTDDIWGYTTFFLSIAPAERKHAGHYTAVVTNAGGSATSAPAVVLVDGVDFKELGQYTADGFLWNESRIVGVKPNSKPVSLVGSNDGMKLMASFDGKKLLLSSDGGKTWRATGQGKFEDGVSAVASSGDGRVLIARGYYDYYGYERIGVSISRDGGATWTASRGDSISSDGKIIVNCNSISTDSGMTWKDFSGSSNCGSVLVSRDGKRFVSFDYNYYLQVSSDGGKTWKSADFVASTVAMSVDGQVIIADVNNGSNITAAVSRDGGRTWTHISALSGRHWKSFAVSADGRKIVAVADHDYMFLSNDSGATWTAINKTYGLSRLDWQTVIMSADGNRIAGAGKDMFVSAVKSSLDMPKEVTGLSYKTTLHAISIHDLVTSYDGSRAAALADNFFSGTGYWSNGGSFSYSNFLSERQLYLSYDSGRSWGTSFNTFSKNDFNGFSNISMTNDGSLLASHDQRGLHLFQNMSTAMKLTPEWADLKGGSVQASGDGRTLAVFNNYVYSQTHNHTISKDGGRTWKLNKGKSFFSTMSQDGSALFTNGTVSEDNGGSWRQIPNFPIGGSLVAAHSATQFVVTAIRNDEVVLFQTENGGANWSRVDLPFLVNSDHAKFSFSANGQVIVIAQPNDFIYLSTDRGSTWTAQVRAGRRDWTALRISGNGRVLYAGSSNPMRYPIVNEGYVVVADLSQMVPASPIPPSYTPPPDAPPVAAPIATPNLEPEPSCSHANSSCPSGVAYWNPSDLQCLCMSN